MCIVSHSLFFLLQYHTYLLNNNTYRILKKLSDDLIENKRIQVRLVSDGGVTAYALEHFLKNPQGETSDSEIFTVTVKKDCEQNDPDADFSRNECFFVELTKVGTVSFVAGNHEEDKSRQFLDILMKSALLATGMKVSHCFSFYHCLELICM